MQDLTCREKLCAHEAHARLFQMCMRMSVVRAGGPLPGQEQRLCGEGASGSPGRILPAPRRTCASTSAVEASFLQTPTHAAAVQSVGFELQCDSV